MSARTRATVRTWAYGARGSTWEWSPSSHQAIRPRSAIGACTAARVPITSRVWPRNTFSQAVYRACGPWSAVNRTANPLPSRPTTSASRASQSRASGTTRIAPRPEASVASAASSSSAGHRSAAAVPGATTTLADGDSPASNRDRSAAPPRYAAQPPSATGGATRSDSGTPGGWAGSAFSAAACRGGMARRRTSPRVPALRRATSRHTARRVAERTGSGETTRRIGTRRPVKSVRGPRDRTTPSRSRPENRTLTRTPARTCSSRSAGTT